MSTCNYLKAQRLKDNLYFNCSNLSSSSLAQLIIDMRTKFNLLIEPWWPILVGVSNDAHEHIIDILRTKYQLHGSHLYAWDTCNHIVKKKAFTLICANRGETIYEMDAGINYIVQIDADRRHCCLGDAPYDSDLFYQNTVKLEPRIK
jgi:hypothetical protein